MNQRQKLVFAVGLTVFVVAWLLVVPYSYSPGGNTLATSVGTLWSPPVYPPKTKPPKAETKHTGMDFSQFTERTDAARDAERDLYRYPMTIRLVPYIAQLLVVGLVTGGLILLVKDREGHHEA